jgi:hypothetical protein
MSVTIPDERLLRQTIEAAAGYLSRLADRPVGAQASAQQLRASLGGRLPDDGLDPSHVIEDLECFHARGHRAGPASSVPPRPSSRRRGEAWSSSACGVGAGTH